MINEIIDVHTHIFPDELAERAIKTLEAKGNIKAILNGNYNSLSKSMDESGITKSICLMIATKPKQVQTINKNAVLNNNKNKKILFSGTLHPDSKNLDEEINYLIENKLFWIKMHPEYQIFCPDSKRMHKLYEKLKNHKFIIHFHCGRDIGFVGNRSAPVNLAKVAEKYPDLTFIFSHLGSYKLYDDVLKYIAGKYKNVYLDISYALDEVDKSFFLKLVDKHGADKILFGTDSPWKPQKKYVDIINDYIEDNEIKNMIFYKNFYKLWPL